MKKLSLLFFCLFMMFTSCASGKGSTGPAKQEEGQTQDWESSNFITYKNDGLIKNAADPFVLKDDDGTYYLYHTGKGFKVYTSSDLVNWVSLGNAMPDDGYKWAKSHFWAPEVVKYNGKYYLHYTGQGADGVKRIGIARSDNPAGPFRDVSDNALFGTPPKSVIDSHIFFDDDGKIYLYYSNAMSTNQVGNQRYSEIWVVELNPDLYGIAGTPKKLTQPEQDWEYSDKAGDYWNEGAVILKRDELYYLMYSANCFCRSDYSVGYATSESPLGPFVKYENNPVLSNETVPDKVSGPGHHTVTTSPDNSELIIVYHSHMDIQAQGGQRMMNIDRMGFRKDGSVYINGPTTTKQLLPSSENLSYANIEGSATVSCNTTQDGFETRVLTDGEFTMYERFADYEWVADGSSAEISFEWSSDQRFKEIWVYNSILESRRAYSGKIVFNDGTETTDIEMQFEPGKATIIKLKDAVESDGFQLNINGNEYNDETGLSEVKVLSSE